MKNITIRAIAVAAFAAALTAGAVVGNPAGTPEVHASTAAYVHSAGSTLVHSGATAEGAHHTIHVHTGDIVND